MISVDEARERILSAFVPTPVERLALVDALGLTLAEAVVSTMSLPPFDTAAMDGFAVRASDIAAASPVEPIVLAVIGEAAAGANHDAAVERGTAIRIMTGAVVPRGATAVVPFELTDDADPGRRPSQVRVLQPQRDKANIRQAGQDAHPGSVVMVAGRVLGPLQLGILASLGQPSVLVHRRPTVAILSTGDELVAPGETLPAAHIFDSNGAALAAAVREAGGEPRSLGIAPDRVDTLRERLREAETADLVLTSGGVSHGDYDIVKDLLAEAGQVQFWRVAMKPGRPLGFGWIDGRPLVGLPGNPGAALVAFEQFIRPAIRKLLGRTSLRRPEIEVVVLGTALNSDGRRCFLRARVDQREGQFVATLASARGSGVTPAQAEANALVIVPESHSEVRDGDRLSAQMLNWDE